MSSFYTFWEICGSGKAFNGSSPLPRSIVCQSTERLSERMPLEIEQLLPTNQGADVWRSDLQFLLPIDNTTAVGIFMVDPFFSQSLFASALKARSIDWVCNLPSVVQHDSEFLTSLEDVNLGHNQEMACLAEFTRLGLRGLVSVNSPDQAKAAKRAGASALLVLPQTHAYDAGFPSISHRQNLVMEIRNVPETADLPLLSLIASEERVNPDQWPCGIDGALCQPVLRKID